MDSTAAGFYFPPVMTSLPTPIRIGIDFGTTNSVIVIARPDHTIQTILFPTPEGGKSETCRTLLALWQEEEGGRRIAQRAVGAYAIEAHMDDPAETRLIMSMKSYLAQASFRETQVFGQRLSLESLIATFLRELMTLGGLSPAQCHVTVGRPVHFVGDNADDALGETRLRAAFAQAGFADVSVMMEPEAAGWRFMQRLNHPATVLVGDFGGGTSDFSVVRFDPASPNATQPLGHAGVGLAGDQFDFRIIDHVVAPYLGRDCTFRIMGGEPLPVPIEWYHALARWHRLSLMRTPRILNEIADVARTASEPDKLKNLIELIREQRGQELYNAVSATKRALSSQATADLSFSQPGLEIATTISRMDFERWIAPDIARLGAGIDAALSEAELEPAQIDRVFLTGGTSFVPAVRNLFTNRFGEDRVELGGEFVSVAEGLALAGA
ncbi:molecular chaperone DnaK [Acetobacter syzygii]|uniref:Hsp70 family protein n=1 Tax=Acetobacter syzygii TaxID=146476 RepID=UPI0005E3749C|nr:Hsp70 family protein [Acetobacter syzygii]GAN71743.1 heat shock protein DnaK/Hsp70 [Acetobacter syzygii]GBR62172.1 molecular chaperone DnaK [Acetobacter syzygii NRIC 0483]GEL56886.1 molecular chaperone DnaK [Acetobacter syzygii]